MQLAFVLGESINERDLTKLACIRLQHIADLINLITIGSISRTY